MRGNEIDERTAGVARHATFMQPIVGIRFARKFAVRFGCVCACVSMYDYNRRYSHRVCQVGTWDDLGMQGRAGWWELLRNRCGTHPQAGSYTAWLAAPSGEGW